VTLYILTLRLLIPIPSKYPPLVPSRWGCRWRSCWLRVSRFCTQAYTAGHRRYHFEAKDENRAYQTKINWGLLGAVLGQKDW